MTLFYHILGLNFITYLQEVPQPGCIPDYQKIIRENLIMGESLLSLPSTMNR